MFVHNDEACESVMNGCHKWSISGLQLSVSLMLGNALELDNRSLGSDLLLLILCQHKHFGTDVILSNQTFHFTLVSELEHQNVISNRTPHFLLITPLRN